MADRGDGGMTGGAPAPSPEDKGEEEEIKVALARNPDDIEAHLRLARLHLSRQEMMEVWKESKWVLERAPGNAQALAYQALVRLAMGQGDVALELLDQAITHDPGLVDGYIYKALVYLRLGRAPEAEGVITAASKRFPDQATDLQRLLSELKTQQGAAADLEAASGQQNPHSDPHPETAISTPPTPGATLPRRRVSGTVDIDRALLKGVAPGATLYVFVREAGFGAGPPVAATRLPATFPARFELGEGDAMMGQSFPDSLLIEARLDADGDPTTRPHSDPKARLDDVKTGRTDVRLVLR
jgi:tetratricopeptide (TPR) repeat protein